MADTATQTGVVQEIMEKLDSMNAALSDGQRAQVVQVAEETVRAAIAEGVIPSGYRPERQASADSDDAVRGTVYQRLGYDLADVELVYDVLQAARVADPRLKGPNELTTKIVEEARKQRAMDTAESGFGAQLVPDAMYVPKIWEAAMENYGVVAPLIESRPMSGPVEKQPVLGSVPDMILVGESTAAISGLSEYGTQKVGSNEVSLTASKLLAHFNFSGEMVEDSIVPFLGLLDKALAKSQAKTLDKLAVNGDETNAATGNINLDDADPADTLYYLADDGIRHAALVDNTANTINVAGALTYAQLVKMPTLMLDRTYDHHWGRPDDPNDLVYLGTPELDDDILNMSEIINSAAYRGQLPTMAPLRGELFRVANRYPYISTSAMALTEADGKLSTTANNNTKGQVLAFNRTGLLWGVRRVAQVETERRAGTDQWRIVLSTRVALGRYTPSGAAPGIEWAAVAYNITNG